MTITTEQLDALEHRSKDDNLAKMIVGSEVRELIAEVRRLRAELTQAWNERIDLSNELHHERTDHVRFTAHILAEKQKAEARVGELEAGVRRLTASLAEMRECYIARTADRDKAEADRAVLVEVVKWYASGLTWHRVDNMDAGLARKDRGELARAALAKAGEPHG